MGVKINLPEVGKKRVVVVGGGFAGMTLVKDLDPRLFQIVLLDRNNYHQFQPLFYQVAMAGLEPSSIVFPFRKMLQGTGKYFRMAEVTAVEPDLNRLLTSHGIVNYDYLVLALGAETHYFGNEEIRRRSIPMKSVSEALYLRNRILEDCETALTCTDADERRGLLNTVIVGGGPTGVELAGALAEMRKFIMPKDYPELPPEESGVWLVESNGRLLKSMSEEASARAAAYLEGMGVKVLLGKRVESHDGKWVRLGSGVSIRADKLIWAAGVTAPKIPGLPESMMGQGSRLVVDRYNRVGGCENIFALGDLSLMTAPGFEHGHPQVAPVAIDQARLLSKNLSRLERGEPMEEFSYTDKGSMATVGRHAAVADIGSLRLSGVPAWLLWLLVHLRALLGVKNKLFVLVSWGWNYVTYDQPLRIIVRPRQNTR
jgi:NADH dehydrogenase